MTIKVGLTKADKKKFAQEEGELLGDVLMDAIDNHLSLDNDGWIATSPALDAIGKEVKPKFKAAILQILEELETPAVKVE
jgi:hypothetical protein